MESEGAGVAKTLMGLPKTGMISPIEVSLNYAARCPLRQGGYCAAVYFKERPDCWQPLEFFDPETVKSLGWRMTCPGIGQDGGLGAAPDECPLRFGTVEVKARG